MFISLFLVFVVGDNDVSVVRGKASIFLQVLEVWPVDLNKKYVILSSVKNILKSVTLCSSGKDPGRFGASSCLIKKLAAEA